MPEPGSMSPSGSRILVVEDNEMVAKVVSSLLENKGWRVLGPIGTVADALRALDLESIDAAILDMDIRGESVIPVADAALRLGIPYVFVTGFGSTAPMPGDHDRAPRIGKPFDAPELFRTVERLLMHRRGVR